MAGMNGVQLAAELKSIAPEVPVILLTGFGDDSFSPETSAGTIDLVVGKPLLRTALRSAVSTVMAKAGTRGGEQATSA